MLSLQEILYLYNIEHNCNTGREMITCPVCSNTRVKKDEKCLALDYEAGTFVCYHSGYSGGMLRLIAYLEGFIDSADERNQAKETLSRLRGSDTAPKKLSRVMKNKIVEVEEVKLIDAISRDIAYNALLDELLLTSNHLLSLKKRGLDETLVRQLKYRSTPKMGQKTLIANIVKRGINLENIPGFYKDEEGWKLVPMPPGILLPIRNGKNQILGFQIRVDDDFMNKNNKKSCKYITLSSKKMNNQSSPALCHLADVYDNFSKCDSIIITEGILKAQVINKFTHIPTLSISGVYAQKHLSQVMREAVKYGLQHCFIAFDMDLYAEPNVMRALKQLQGLMYELGLSSEQLIWNREYKGLDDYYLFLSKDK